MSEWKIVLVAVHILRISLMSQAFELKNGRGFPDSIVTRETVESFISKVQNIELSKTPLNYHGALGDDNRTIHTNGRKNQLEKLEAARSAYLWLPLFIFGYLWLPLVTFPGLTEPF